MKTTEVIYLDYAAATPMDSRVLETMLPYFSDFFYNPSSPYLPAVAVRRDYEAAKQRLAETIGARGDELVMTAGATESVNLAFAAAKGHVIASNIEHHAVLAAAKEKNDHTLVDVLPNGTVDLAALEHGVRDDTELISIGLANNELGTIQPLRKIAALVEKIRADRLERGNHTPLYLHSDASQGFGLIDIHVARLGVDLLTLNAAKIYGPKQVGLLWSKRSVILEPQVVGGGQEQGLRSGTENVAGVIGFAKAAELAIKKQTSEAKRLGELRDELQARLLAAFPDALLSGAKKHRLPGHLHISFSGVDAERLVFLLEAEGVLVATGSACAANKHTRSHVLVAIGLKDDEINGSLRLTLGAQTTEETITIAAEKIINALRHEIERIQ